MRWFLVYFFGASPYKDESYKCKLMAKEKTEAISLRSSRCGYSNPARIPVNYNNFKKHLADLQFAVDSVHSPYTDLGIFKNGQQLQLNDHTLQIGNEYYFPIRLKPPKPYDDMVKALTKHGVNYIEARVFDLNPFTFSGVTSEQFYATNLFLLYCLFLPSPKIEDADLDEGSMNQQSIALHGRQKELMLSKNGEPVQFKKWTQEILDGMKKIAPLLDIKKSKYQNIVTELENLLHDPSNLPASRIVREMEEKGLNFIEYGLELAKKNAKT